MQNPLSKKKKVSSRSYCIRTGPRGWGHRPDPLRELHVSCLQDAPEQGQEHRGSTPAVRRPKSETKKRISSSWMRPPSAGYCTRPGADCPRRPRRPKPPQATPAGPQASPPSCARRGPQSTPHVTRSRMGSGGLDGRARVLRRSEPCRWPRAHRRGRRPAAGRREVRARPRRRGPACTCGAAARSARGEEGRRRASEAQAARRARH